MFRATLDLARYAQGITQHRITGVDRASNTFHCSESLSAALGEYTDGGTCWFLSGNSEGQFGTIAAAADQWVRLQDYFDDGYNTGDLVALSGRMYFNSQNLINAVNHVLYDYPIMAIYEGTTEDPFLYRRDTEVYELPDGVDNIRRIEIERNSYSEVPGYTVSHYWRQAGRELHIQPRGAYRNDGKIRIHYVKDHGMILDKGKISGQVDREYLRKMAAVWLWMHEIQMKHKDNPIAVDMYNQARIDEEAMRRRNIPESRLLQKDQCFMW